MKRNIFWGLVLIGIAVLLLSNEMGFDFHIPVFTLIKFILALYLVINGLKEKSFFQVLLGCGVGYCQVDNLLNLTRISHGLIVLVSVLIGIGLDMMLGDLLHKKSSKKAIVYTSDNHEIIVDSEEEKQYLTETEDDDEIRFSNNFGSVTKYINNQNITNVRLENNFGSMNVYMENASINGLYADIRCESNFGEIRLYLPTGYRVEASEDTTLGRVDYEGISTIDESAPVIRIRAEANFGHIKIFLG